MVYSNYRSQHERSDAEGSRLFIAVDTVRARQVIIPPPVLIQDLVIQLPAQTLTGTLRLREQKCFSKMKNQRIDKQKAKAVSEIHFAIHILHQRFVALLTRGGYQRDDADFNQALRFIERNQSRIQGMTTTRRRMLTSYDAEMAIGVRNKYSHQAPFDLGQYQQGRNFLLSLF